MNKRYMEKKPQIKSGMKWITGKDGMVTIEMENKSILKKLLNKPKFSYIHLDELGSFVWKQMDGKSDVCEIGRKVKENFGESAQPLYERVVKFFCVLKSYKFIKWVA